MCIGPNIRMVVAFFAASMAAQLLAQGAPTVSKTDAVNHQGAEDPQPTAAAEAPTALRAPAVSVLAGMGNAFGGHLGIQGEYYLAQGRLSVFGGVGYWFADQNYPSGVAGAVGARLYTKGLRNRAFLELSVLSVGGAYATNEAGEVIDQAILYGPSAEVGYQYNKKSGFTWMLLIGVSHARWSAYERTDTAVTFGLGFGHTWRRSPGSPAATSKR